MRILLALVALLLVGCDEPQSSNYAGVGYQRVIPPERLSEASKWATEMAAAANTHYKGNGEDAIKQAQKSAEELFGVSTIGVFMHSKENWYPVFIPYDKCSPELKALCDKWVSEHVPQRPSAEAPATKGTP